MNVFFNRAQQTSDTLSLLYLSIWIMLVSLGKKEQSVCQGQEDLSDCLTCNSPDKFRDCFCSVSAELTSVIQGQKSKCSVSWLWCSKGSFTTSLLNNRKLLGYIIQSLMTRPSCWEVRGLARDRDIKKFDSSANLSALLQTEWLQNKCYCYWQPLWGLTSLIHLILSVLELEL